MAYATVAQLRVHLSQVASGAAKDAELQDVLDEATALIERELKFAFGPYGGAATAKDVFCEAGASALPQYLIVPAFLAGSITAVVRVYDKGTSYETTEAVTDYAALDDGRLWREGGWSGRTWYRITAKWGYGEAPADVVRLCKDVAVALWHSRPTGSMAQGVEGGGAVIRPRALTAEQVDRLDSIRRDYLGIVVG